MPAQFHKVKVGKTFYSLKYGTKALRRYEGEADLPITALATNRFGISTIVYLLHAGMVYEDPDVTLDDLDAILDDFLESGGDIGPIMETITEALAESGWFSGNPTKASDSTKDSGKKPAKQE